MDRDARKKATAATCYTKKRGRFLPQPEPADVPLFRTGYRSRTAYRELPEAPLSCPDFPAYIHSLILSSLGKGGRAAVLSSPSSRSIIKSFSTRALVSGCMNRSSLDRQKYSQAEASV